MATYPGTGVIPGGSITITNTGTGSTWQNVGWTTINPTYFKPVKIMPPHRYLIAIEMTNNIKHKVRWVKNPKGGYEVVANRVLIGNVIRKPDGWSCADRFGTMVEGFASRRAASIHLLKDHYQFTPKLELADDQHK